LVDWGPVAVARVGFAAMPTLAILGPGAIGAFIAAAVARDGSPVTVIGREPTIAQIGQRGIQVDSPRFGAFEAKVDAARYLTEEADVLVIATKAPQLEAALDRVQAEPKVVVPLLNGIDHVERLRRRFACPVLAGSINAQTYKDGPTSVVHRVDLARVNIAAPGHIGLEKALRRAGFDIGPHVDETTMLWRKLARLGSIALATAASGAQLGDVREDAYAVAAEAVPVAQSEGADVELEAILEELRELSDNSSSSLRVDVDNGALDTELEAISGPILRGAQAHGLKCATVQRLVSKIEDRL
jgi:2-dehydropantoate 2-reductase